MALRIKNRWFDKSKERSDEELGGIMAFITWRIANNQLKKMREAQFEIEVGPQYFAFLEEFAIFLATVVDRIVFSQIDVYRRITFTSSLVKHMAGTLEESKEEWLGKPEPGQQPWGVQFIEKFNQANDAYRDFPAVAEEPSFALVRYFGSRLEAVLPPNDHFWIKDQLYSYEVPEAMTLIRRGLKGMFTPNELTQAR